jgi:hypothetical protein
VELPDLAGSPSLDFLLMMSLNFFLAGLRSEPEAPTARTAKEYLPGFNLL